MTELRNIVKPGVPAPVEDGMLVKQADLECDRKDLDVLFGDDIERGNKDVSRRFLFS